MNSTAVGNTFEDQVFEYFQAEISGNRFMFRTDCCKIYRKKGYYSRDRGTEIIFDVSIEVYLPGATEFSMLMLIECKKYNHPVPVNDIEEFFAKLQQISGANSKGIIVSTNSFQAGTMSFARSKGMGLLRHYDRSGFKWMLKRSPSAGMTSANFESSVLSEKAICYEEFRSEYFDFYGQSNLRFTNSLWEFFGDLSVHANLSHQELAAISNRKPRSSVRVEFIGRDDIEAMVTATLADIDYQDSKVSLEAICEKERLRAGLRVSEQVTNCGANAKNSVLGEINFAPLEIRLYNQMPRRFSRERFTLAHEIAHHLLGHAKYMDAERCQSSDLRLGSTPGVDSSDVYKLEWQANYFASCLLLPKHHVLHDFFMELERLEIKDIGFGHLFVDNQRVNLDNFYRVTNQIMFRYSVSRTAVRIRLQNLGVLTDARIRYKDGETIKTLIDNA